MNWRRAMLITITVAVVATILLQREKKRRAKAQADRLETSEFDRFEHSTHDTG